MLISSPLLKKCDVVSDDGKEVNFHFLEGSKQDPVTDNTVESFLNDKVEAIFFGNGDYDGYIGCPHVTDITARIITKKCPKLTTLFTDGCNQITNEFIIIIAKHYQNRLQELSVRRNRQITNKSMNIVFQNCPNLKDLRCANCSLTALPDHIGSLTPNLHRLWIENNNITSIPRSITNLIGTLPDDDFYIYCNPLQQPNEEIARGGLQAIARYYEDIDRTKGVSCKRVYESNCGNDSEQERRVRPFRP